MYRSKKTKIYMERGAIAVVAVMLCLSLLSLSLKVTASRAASASEPYPDLYVSTEVDVLQSGEKTVYLTFDDGPSQNTLRVLDVLAQEQVPATFFVCAQQDGEEDVPGTLRRIKEEGHVIGLHTYTHDYTLYQSLDSYLEDLNRINSYILEHTGYRADILRFPGGSLTSNCDGEVMQAIADEVTRRGYVYYDWNVVSGDDVSYVQDADYLVERVLEQIKGVDNAIVLFHDGRGPDTTPDAVRQLIPRLREEGYAFASLTPAVEPIQLRHPTQDQE